MFADRMNWEIEVWEMLAGYEIEMHPLETLSDSTYLQG